ncbi:MAG TPA: hypothetical protein VNX88_18480 [Terriglobales bacterium]|jgi:hypothetical protein|nr:hypothetical protein [Terriglobales bacterium]
MDSRRRNWTLWAGFLLSLIALLIYVLGFQITRSVFWLSAALFVVAVWLLVSGFKRARREPELYRGRRAGPILATLSVVLVALFGFMTVMVTKYFPAAANAPKVGSRAPEFALLNTSSSPVTLGQLLSGSALPGNASGSARGPRGILLVFYRGYW